MEQTLIVLLLILFLGLVIPELFKKFKLPFVTSIILMGAILGPNGFNYINTDPVIEFFGFLGFTFLMFMTGLETDTKYLKKSIHKVSILALSNSLLPFFTGIAIARFFGYSWETAILLGIIFISSSVAVIIPLIKSEKTFKHNVEQTIISTVILEDIISLFALAFIFQTIAPATNIPTILYFIILLLSITALKLFLPKIADYFMSGKFFKKKNTHEDQLRFVIVVLIAVSAYFASLGLHPILAAFLVGLLLADHVTHEKIYTKFHTLAYGLFVPVFFFIAGMQIDSSLFLKYNNKNLLLISIIFGLILSKFLSGYIAGRYIKFTKVQSLKFGLISSTKLTTTLAATYAASSVGLLDETLNSAIIILILITTILIPILLKLIPKPTKQELLHIHLKR